MEGMQVKIPLAKVRECLKIGDHAGMKAMARTALREMAERHQIGYSVQTPQIDYDLVLPLEEELAKKILEEGKRFNPVLPFPSPACNSISIQIELPTRGKVGVAEYNQIVEV